MARCPHHVCCIFEYARTTGFGEHELREEIRMKKHMRLNVVESRLRWEGHIQRISEDRLTKRARKTEEVVKMECQC